MNHGPPPPPLLVVIILVILVIVFLRNKSGSYEPEEIRRRNLVALARKLQLQFDSKRNFDLPREFLFLTCLKPGIINYAYNIFHGYYRSEYQITIFDYFFSVPGGKRSYDYYWSVYVLELKAHFPDIVISHESWESRLAEKLGQEHISFESAEFSHAFRVRSQDKKFAFDVCNARMMEFLLANQDLTIEIRGTMVALIFEDWLRPEKVENNLSRLIEIRKLLPQYLFTKP